MIEHNTAILGIECVCVGIGYAYEPETDGYHAQEAYFELRQVLVEGVNIIELLSGDMIEKIERQVEEETE